MHRFRIVSQSKDKAEWKRIVKIGIEIGISLRRDRSREMRQKRTSSVQIIGISEMEIRIQVGSRVDQDGGDYQAGKWDYWEECHGPRSESDEEECDEAGYSKTQAHVGAVPAELPVLVQPPEPSQLHALAQLRVVLEKRKRKYVLS